MPFVPFQDHLKTLRQEVNDWMESYFSKLMSNGTVPARLNDAIRYSLFAPGKRIRPLLVLLTCDACESSRNLALPAAASVEMIHTYSLVHDDLPAMDNDDLRRGLPTSHKAFDEATAILVGDALHTLAFQVLAQEIQPSEQAAACVSALSQAAGLLGMVGGQMDDILHQGQSQGSLQELQSIHSRKTGALLKTSVTLGAIIGLKGQIDNHRFAALQRFAQELGLAFQIADDLLDVQSNSAALGKKTQKDATQGKLTYPGLLGVNGAKKELHAAHERGLAALGPLGDQAVLLKELFGYVVQRDR